MSEKYPEKVFYIVLIVQVEDDVIAVVKTISSKDFQESFQYHAGRSAYLQMGSTLKVGV